MRILLAALLLLCPHLAACADRTPGIALGVGTHGAGVALFTDSGWMGFGPYGGGVMVGFGGGDYSTGRIYSSGRIVRREPAGMPPSGSMRDWRRDYAFPSLLAAYRESFRQPR